MHNINTLLREARESRGLTIKDAAQALKLKERHIQMLEDGKMAELTREIYLKGLLKTYSSWLNIDGGDVIAKIKHDKKNVIIRQNGVTSSSIPFDLSYIAALARRPGLNIFVLSIIIAAVIYVFWYSNHKTTPSVDALSAIEKTTDDQQQVNVKYSNVQEPYLGHDIVFFPHGDVELKILDTGTGEEKVNKLSDGDVFFFKTDEAQVISSDHPELIDVFLDNGGDQQPIGTLEKLLIQF